MDDKAKRLVVNAVTFGRVPFVVLFMVLAILHAYTPRAWWLSVAATVSLGTPNLFSLRPVEM